MKLIKLILICIPFLFLTIEQKAQGGFKSRFVSNGSINCLSKFIYPVDTGYIALGFVTESFSNQPVHKICIMGLNSKGNLVWLKKYGEMNQQYLSTVSRKSTYFINNSLYYTGVVKDSLNVIRGVLIKFNLLGDTLWQKHYSDPNKVVVTQAIAPSVDGALIITGLYEISSNSTRPCLLIKSDTLGNELWRKQIDKVVPNVFDGRAIAQDSVSKKIVIVGYQYIGTSTSWSAFDSFLVLDSIGNMLAHKKYTNIGGVFSDVIQTTDNKFVAVGTRYYSGTLGGNNYQGGFAVKVDLNNLNSPQWVINGYGQLSTGSGFVLANQRSDGKIFISGCIDTLLVLNQWPNTLIRYTLINEQNGQVIWNKLYNYKYNSPTTYNNQAQSSTCLLSGNSWISSISVNNSSLNPFFFVKYDSTGCDTTQEYCMDPLGFYTINSTVSDIDLFPNPTEGDLTFSYDRLMEIDKVMIVNSIGQCLQEEDVQNENSKIIISTAKLEKGIYLIQFKGAFGTITKQFIKN